MILLFADRDNFLFLKLARQRHSPGRSQLRQLLMIMIVLAIVVYTMMMMMLLLLLMMTMIVFAMVAYRHNCDANRVPVMM